MSKIGIYGGSFNPIHIGHINIIKGFYDELKLDKIIVIPSAVSPHKSNEELESGVHRLNMCKIALSKFPFCEVSEIEFNRNGKSYTIDTLKELKRIYPSDDFCLLMGEDMFMTIDRWYQSEAIFEIAEICCAPRSLNSKAKLVEKALELKENYNSFRSSICDINYVEASSTDARNGVVTALTDEVKEYIKSNSLYNLNV